MLPMGNNRPMVKRSLMTSCIQHKMYVVFGAVVLILLLYLVTTTSMPAPHVAGEVRLQHLSSGLVTLKSSAPAPPCKADLPYDSTYPLTPPTHNFGRRSTQYRIAIVSDLDKDSKLKDNDAWISYLQMGYLEIDEARSDVRVRWDNSKTTLQSGLSYGARGMELSELIVFDGHLLAIDDRTGVVYRVQGGVVVPWVVLTDGDGANTKGFKCEWATVKDNLLYVGGLGKEWTTAQGKVLNHNPQWVKTVDTRGNINHIDWTKNYDALRDKMGMRLPGYLWHEAVCWSAQREQWVFLPRRASTEAYDDVLDESRGSDLMLTTSTFNTIGVSHVGELLPTHGFSSFKFVPGTADAVIVALKTEEYQGTTATFITAFDTRSGRVLLQETKVADLKYEGIEFV